MTKRLEKRAAEMRERMAQHATARRDHFIDEPGLSLLGLERVRRLTAIAERHGLTVSLLASGCRFREVVQARAEACYELRTELGYSYPRIGKLLRLHHTSVIYLCRKFERELRKRQTQQLAREWAASLSA